MYSPPAAAGFGSTVSSANTGRVTRKAASTTGSAVAGIIQVGISRDLLITLGIGFGLLVLIQVATGAVRSWAVLYLSATLNLQWLSNVFAHMMRLPVSWFEKRHTGDVMSRFNAIQHIQQTMTTSFIEAVLDGLLVVLTLAMMFVYSGTLTGIALGCVAVYALLRWAFFRPLRDATEESIVHDAKRETHFLESLRGVQSIKLFGRQEERRSRWLNLVVDAVNQDLVGQKLGLGFRSANALVFGIERVAIVWIGATLVLDSAFSVGMLFAFMAYKEQFSARVAGLVRGCPAAPHDAVANAGERVIDEKSNSAGTRIAVRTREGERSLRELANRHISRLSSPLA